MATETKATVELGSISHGTLRAEDLLEAFVETLEYLGATCECVDEAADLLNLDVIENWTDEQREQAEFLIHDLEDALQELAPPYCYFGTHPGDGSDFGFWPDVESLEDAIQEQGVKWGDYTILPDDGLIVSISDHGNVSLYKIEVGQEVWSVV